MNLGIVDKNGFLFASGRQFESRIDYSQNEFFKETIRNNEFAIGEYFLDPVSHKKIINMGYPIFDDKKITVTDIQNIRYMLMTLLMLMAEDQGI